ncbi:hypothetical protein Aoki45_03490 [Algoriphagus sp. oki45]|uniref:universal stress protein n=1 Tax=Algoriphagus sp. oki45 TaxID=3067294 RepID=UPI0027FECD27|nr:hypothetical protein Aoki45_03490 [Algoriphagus sp. oki45]
MLEKIIVPVDFSPEAENALWFAAEIAKRSLAHVTLLHAGSQAENKAQEEEKLNKLRQKLKQHSGEELSCSVELSPVDLLEAIKTRINSGKADLIVMGTKGASGLKRILIGSNTVRVISEIKVPVLVIPGIARFTDFHNQGKNRVVLATDLEEIKDESGLDFLDEFVKLMTQLKLRILNIRQKNTKLDYEKRLLRKSLLSSFGQDVDAEKATVFSSNILDGIQYYLDKNADTGLIVMISKESRGLFQRHFTHEMAAVTHYPLLVLNEKTEI